MKKSIYLVSILSILSFDGCSGTKKNTANYVQAEGFFKNIPEGTCKISGGTQSRGDTSKVCRYVQYADAQEVCKDVGGRLPTMEDVKALALDCGVDLTLSDREFMKEDRKNSLNKKYKECISQKHHLGIHRFWTSTPLASNARRVYVPKVRSAKMIRTTINTSKAKYLRLLSRSMINGDTNSVVCINPSVRP